MELVAGGSLDKQMQPGQPWPVESAMRIVKQIAEALDYAHAQGIVHRDIKPGNILLHHNGQVKVADFGLARLVSQTITRTGDKMGTPAYMSPQQI